jgi:HEPN domain-containing protein
MTNATLAHSYLVKAQSRLKALEVFLDEGDYSDVVREAQEIVELSLKAMLRYVGIEPPKYHDVGPLVMEHRERFREIASEDISRLARREPPEVTQGNPREPESGRAGLFE